MVKKMSSLALEKPTVLDTADISLDILLALRTCVIGGKQQKINKIDDELTPRDYDSGFSYKISR